MNYRLRFVSTLFLLCFAVSVHSTEASDPEDQESIGVRAGETVNEMRTKANENYAVASEKVEVAKAQFNALAADRMKTFNEQAEKTISDLREAFQNLMTAFDEEVRKFNETLNAKEDEENPAPVQT